MCKPDVRLNCKLSTHSLNKAREMMTRLGCPDLLSLVETTDENDSPSKPNETPKQSE
jgi:hypothetical protein